MSGRVTENIVTAGGRSIPASAFVKKAAVKLPAKPTVVTARPVAKVKAPAPKVINQAKPPPLPPKKIAAAPARLPAVKQAAPAAQPAATTAGAIIAAPTASASPTDSEEELALESLLRSNPQARARLEAILNGGK